MAMASFFIISEKAYPIQPNKPQNKKYKKIYIISYIIGNE